MIFVKIILFKIKQKCWASFEGIHKNMYYIVIMAGQWILHILLVQFEEI